MPTVPNAQLAIVDPRKVAFYLLNPKHRGNRGKAALFGRLGFSALNWGDLSEALLELVRTQPAAAPLISAYGTKYIVDGLICGPGGDAAAVRTVWIVDRGDGRAEIRDGVPRAPGESQMIRELDSAVLTAAVPEARLEVGDIGTVVHVYDGGKAYELEFVLLEGDTLAVVTVNADQVRPIGARDIASARPVPPE